MKSNTYFQGLNGLRFIAAYLVLITHSESIRAKLGYFNIESWSISRNGGLAVQFFFVLSGFLISFLLFQEQANTNTINIKQFYIRRILRIWPLYYLMVFIGLYLLPLFLLPLLGEPYQPEFNLWTGSALYLFFLPNLANSWYNTRHLTSLWSIGVEEQFYLFWAPLVKYLRKYFIAICVTIIISKIGLMYYLDNSFPEHWVTHFFAKLEFECMAIGGLGAYWFYNGGKIEGNFWFSKPIQWVVLLLIVALITADIGIQQSNNWIGQIWYFIFHTYFYTISSNLLFLHLILNVSKNPIRIINTDNNVFNFLGEISYGIYMYHPLLIHFVIKLIGKKLVFLSGWSFLVVMYIIVTAITILVSYLSFQYFEKPIIKLKRGIRI